MLESDPDSVNIFDQNMIDDFYPGRPKELEDLCLYDFIKWYVYSGIDSSGCRQYRKLNKPRIPNHKLYDPNKEDQRDDYYYSLLLLFVPFRVESDLLGKHQTPEQAFNEYISSGPRMEGHHEKLQKILKAQATVRKINEHREVSEELCPKTNDHDESAGLEIPGEAAVTAMNDVNEMDVCDKDDITLKECVKMLNADQIRIFQMVTNHLCHQKQHELGKCQCNDLRPLHSFISGVGGTGKSFLIDTIRRQVADIWKDDAIGDIKCTVAAPTGLAAYNVGGVTVHCLFQLPIEHDGKTAQYWPLSKTTQKIMRTNLRSLKFIIIDEMSMLSNLNLVYIHLRLEELFGGCEWFGSMNVLFVGDLLQLPPVNGLPVFSQLTSKTIFNRLGCMSSVNVWRDTITYDELTINERQKKDVIYSTILDEVRRGCPSDDSLSHLHKRKIDGSVAEKFKELSESGFHPVCLFPTRKGCEEHNMNMLSILDAKLEHLVCTDEIDETTSTRKWSKKLMMP